MILKNRGAIGKVLVYYKDYFFIRPEWLKAHNTVFNAEYRLGMGFVQLAPNELSRWSE